MMKKSLGKNAALNVIKTSLSILFPLITYPYALRIVGVDKIGAVSYVSSIVGYFSLFAMLGVSTYSIREGAKVRENKDNFEIFANQVFTINVITTIISLFALIITVILIPQFHAHYLLFGILGCNVWFSTFGVDWINTVYEDYLYITIRGIIIHIVILFFLFLFVKSESDYYIYAVLQVLSTGLVCISNWIYCRKYVKLHIVKNPRLNEHLPRLIILFANALAITIYVSFDTTMLGWMKGEYDVGLYTTSTKIYSIAKSIMVAIYSVTIPRLALFYGKNDLGMFRKLYTKLFSYCSVLLLPAGIGLMTLSKDIIFIFGGERYLPGATALQILSIALVFSVFGGLVCTCLNVTIRREKENLIATLLSALLNCLLNLFFIEKYSYVGAAFTTLIAEAFVLFFCFIRIPNKSLYLESKPIIKNIGQSLIACAPIIFISWILNRTIQNVIVRMALIIIASIISYVIIQLLQRNEVIRSCISVINNKLRQK